MTHSIILEYAANNPAWVETQAYVFRRHRDVLLSEVVWKAERYQRELRLGLPTTDTAETIAALDQYINDLCNVPQQADFPFNIVWPIKP
jgi:hypothetical protein